jgi:hypothetical protein
MNPSFLSTATVHLDKMMAFTKLTDDRGQMLNLMLPDSRQAIELEKRAINYIYSRRYVSSLRFPII